VSELLRALATLAEPPAEHTPRLAQLLGLSAPPAPAAYTDLFVFQQTPYASAYLSPDGMVGGEPRDRIAGFWRALGIEPPHEPDHLATMLGAYAALCDCAAGESEPRRHEALQRARHAFLWEHLLSWVPCYAQSVQRHADEPFVTWARLLLEALFAEAHELGAPAALPLQLRDVAGLVDPRQGDPQAFLASVLAPARSGMILTRNGLARGAHALELGLRAGDRRQAVHFLLEQDAAATLGWLAGEARAWLALHQSLATTIGPLADAWAGRAAAAAALLDALRLEAVEGQSA
jgi:TorA maturation chaperone TorD